MQQNFVQCVVDLPLKSWLKITISQLPHNFCNSLPSKRIFQPYLIICRHLALIDVKDINHKQILDLQMYINFYILKCCQSHILVSSTILSIHSV